MFLLVVAWIAAFVLGLCVWYFVARAAVRDGLLQALDRMDEADRERVRSRRRR